MNTSEAYLVILSFMADHNNGWYMGNSDFTGEGKFSLWFAYMQMRGVSSGTIGIFVLEQFQPVPFTPSMNMHVQSFTLNSFGFIPYSSFARQWNPTTFY